MMGTLRHQDFKLELGRLAAGQQHQLKLLNELRAFKTEQATVNRATTSLLSQAHKELQEHRRGPLLNVHKVRGG